MNSSKRKWWSFRSDWVGTDRPGNPNKTLGKISRLLHLCSSCTHELSHSLKKKKSPHGTEIREICWYVDLITCSNTSPFKISPNWWWVYPSVSASFHGFWRWRFLKRIRWGKDWPSWICSQLLCHDAGSIELQPSNDADIGGNNPNLMSPVDAGTRRQLRMGFRCWSSWHDDRLFFSLMKIRRRMPLRMDHHHHHHHHLLLLLH
jgi:hypothetical protein